MRTINLPDPDRRIDAEIHRTHFEYVLDIQSGPICRGLPVPDYCRSLDAALCLLAKVAPDWSWTLQNHQSQTVIHAFPDYSHGKQNSLLPDGIEIAFPKPDRTIRRLPGSMEVVALSLVLSHALSTGTCPNVSRAAEFFEKALASRELPYGKEHTPLARSRARTKTT